MALTLEQARNIATIASLAILVACATRIPYDGKEAERRSSEHFGDDPRARFAEVPSDDGLTDSIYVWFDDTDRDATRLAKALSAPGARIGIGGPVPAKTRAIVESALERLAGSPDRGSELLVLGPVSDPDSLATLARDAGIELSFADL